MYVKYNGTSIYDHEGPVPERPISANPGLKFCSTFCDLLSYVLLRETFRVIISFLELKAQQYFVS